MLITQFERLKTDPDYVASLIQRYAENCVDTLPHFETGQRYTPDELLSNKRFIGMKLRRDVHKFLMRIGRWSVLLEYFRDIEKLDDTKGRQGALFERKCLMSQVRFASYIVMNHLITLGIVR